MVNEVINASMMTNGEKKLLQRIIMKAQTFRKGMIDSFIYCASIDHTRSTMVDHNDSYNNNWSIVVIAAGRGEWKD